MTYINPVSRSDADPSTQESLDRVQAQLGMVPNLFSTLAKAPPALNALLVLNEAIAAGNLSSEEREIIALATSQGNRCGYCLSAHTLLGKNAGLSIEETRLARTGRGSTQRSDSIAAFALALVEQRGHVSESELDRFKASGLSEADLLEIVANVAATTFTNLANNVARTQIDFPVVNVRLAA